MSAVSERISPQQQNTMSGNVFSFIAVFREELTHCVYKQSRK